MSEVNQKLMIECRTLDGYSKLIPKEQLQFRPAAYGIVFHLDRILLVNTRTTGTYSLPGGGIEVGETLEIGLKREFKEETGIEIELEQLCHFAEEFFYYEPTEEAFQSFRFFYLCVPKTVVLVPDNEVEDEEVEKPRWVKMDSLQASDFQSHGDMIMKLITSKQARKHKEVM